MLYTTHISRSLEVMFKGTKVNYAVIPCDYLEQIDWSKYPVALVVNDSPSTSIGRHWLAIWAQSRDSPVYFFCSYGLGINSYTSIFKNLFKTIRKDVVENLRTLQAIGSTVCGHYCLYALHKFYHGCCPMSLYHNFSTDTAANDRKVKRYVAKYLFSNRRHKKFMHFNKNQCCTPFK